MNLPLSRDVQPFAETQFGVQQNTRARASKLHPLIAMLIISLAIPEEFSFYIGSLRLTITRAILLVAAPALAQAYFEKRGARLVLADIMVLCACGWMIVAVANVTDIGDALAHAGPEVLEFSVAYFAFRLWTKSGEQVLAAFSLFCLVISIASLVSVLDSLTSTYFIHNLSASITGYIKVRQEDYRLGLLRAAGPFEHPIHLGVMCGSSVVIAVGAPIRRRLLYIAASSVGLVLSFSSAPLQACIMGIGLIAYSRLFSRFKHRWAFLGGMVVSAVAAAFMISESPLSFITNQFTFDPASAWARQFEWQNAVSVIEQYPWFGIAFFQWAEIAKQLGTFESVDSLWLYLALGYGVPGALLVGGAVLSAAFVRSRFGPDGPAMETERNAMGELLSILLVLTVYLAFTVHYWASPWVFIGVLMGLRTSRGCAG